MSGSNPAAKGQTGAVPRVCGRAAWESMLEGMAMASPRLSAGSVENRRAIVLTVVVLFAAYWPNERFNRTDLILETDDRAPLVTLWEARPCPPDDWRRL